MRAVTPATQAALDAGSIIERELILFDFVEGLFGYWSGIGPFTYNGVVYQGAGTLIEVDTIKQGSNLEAEGLSVKLTEVPNSDLTPDVLATVESYTYHQRPVQLMSAFFDATTYALLSVELIFSGYIDQVVHDNNVEGNAYVEGRLESRFRDHQRRGYRVRSDADQKRIAAIDSGLRHVGVVATETILFGRTISQAAQQAAAAAVPKKKSFFERIFG
jgi:hypothetical protein